MAATFHMYTFSVSLLFLYDFDATTGVVSNCRYITDPSNARHPRQSIAFSADSRYLYACWTEGHQSSGVNELSRIDITQPTPAAMFASRSVLKNIMIHAMQMAPDGHIYVLEDSGSVGRINNPGANNNSYQHAVLQFPKQYSGGYTLPQEVMFITTPRQSRNNINICFGENKTLQGRSGAINYKWNNNSAGPTMNINTSGIYWVRSEMPCAVYVDTFVVNNIDFNVFLGPDTTICEGTQHVLSLDISGAVYRWQDQSSASNFTLSDAGRYFVEVNVNGCKKSDTIDVAVKNTVNFNLGNDTSVCPTRDFLIKITDTFDAYLWSNDSKANNIQVSIPGTYWLTAQKSGCSKTDSIHVTHKDPYVRLGNDTLMCNGDEMLLVATSLPGSNYYWHDGSKEATHTARKPGGEYWVEANNECGTFRDTVNVQFQKCYCEPFIPNAFTPNNDGLNDWIGPVVDCAVTSYKFIIVNRFGETIFNTDNPKQYWNGMYKASYAEVGAYYYYIQFTGPFNKEYFYKGDFLLLQ